MLKIVDISSHQSPNFQNVGEDGAIIKATEGIDYVSPACNPQFTAYNDLNKLLGLYHYAQGLDPIEEADWFLNNIKNYLYKAVLVLDWESGSNQAWGDSNWPEKFVTHIHDRTGIWPLIYIQASAIEQVKHLSEKCGLWIAGYPDLRDSWITPSFIYSTDPWPYFTGWQYSTSNGLLDRSIFNLSDNNWHSLANPKNDNSINEANNVYIVQNGDTLINIAEKLSIPDWHILIELNNIDNPDMITVGQTLKY